MSSEGAGVRVLVSDPNRGCSQTINELDLNSNRAHMLNLSDSVGGVRGFSRSVSGVRGLSQSMGVGGVMSFRDGVGDVCRSLSASNREPHSLNESLGSSLWQLELNPRRDSGVSQNALQLTGQIWLDQFEVTVGTSVCVRWEVLQSVTERDFIGIFECPRDAATPVNIDSLLDARLRGISNSRRGQINWTIEPALFAGREATSVVFCYIDDYNRLRARSPPLRVRNPVGEATTIAPPLQRTLSQITEPVGITVMNFRCSNLRSKLFGAPSPYVRLQIMPHRGRLSLGHHGQKVESRSLDNQLNPAWREQFGFFVLPSDILQVEVRDKVSVMRPSVSHFLGRVRLPVAPFLEQRGGSTNTFHLEKRLPSDCVQGNITLTVRHELVLGGHLLPPSSTANMPSQLIAPSVSMDSILNHSNSPLISIHATANHSGDDNIIPIQVNNQSDPRTESHDTEPSIETPPMTTSTTQAEDSNPPPADSSPINQTGEDNSEGNNETPSLRRQLSHPEASINTIRQTLHGRRIASFRVSRNVNRAVDFTRSLTVDTHLGGMAGNSLTETLPPNWEVRTDAIGRQVYYDHDNKVVRLDRTNQETGGRDADIQSFARRATRNSFIRQRSQELLSHNRTPSPRSRSHTITGAQASQDDNKNGGHEPSFNPLSATLAALSTGNDVTNNQLTLEPLEGEEKSNTEQVKPSGNEEVDISDTMGVKEGENEGVKVEQITEEEVKSKDTGIATETEIHWIPRQASLNIELKQSPGFKFLTRADLFKFAKDAGHTTFFKNLTLLELIQSIRNDHSLYQKYQHSNKLVDLLNSFARTDCDLPSGWEKKLEPKTDKHVFIDHNSRLTTYIDPRLPYPGNKLITTGSAPSVGVVARSRPYQSDRADSHPQSLLTNQPLPPSPPPRPPSTLTRSTSGNITSETSYSERVVHFLRQPSIFIQLETGNNGPLSRDLRQAIQRIQTGGVSALEAIQNESDDLSFDLTMLLSLFEDEISHYTFAVASSRSPDDDNTSTNSFDSDSSDGSNYFESLESFRQPHSFTNHAPPMDDSDLDDFLSSSWCSSSLLPSLEAVPAQAPQASQPPHPPPPPLILGEPAIQGSHPPPAPPPPPLPTSMLPSPPPPPPPIRESSLLSSIQGSSSQPPPPPPLASHPPPPPPPLRASHPPPPPVRESSPLSSLQGSSSRPPSSPLNTPILQLPTGLLRERSQAPSPSPALQLDTFWTRSEHRLLSSVLSEETSHFQFSGHALEEIREFFQHSNIYQLVLRRYNGISSDRRMFIHWMASDTTEQLQTLLQENLEFAQFVRDMVSRYMEPEDSVRHADIDSVVQNHQFHDLPVRRILEYFVEVADLLEIYGMSHLHSVIRTISVPEFEQLLATDPSLQAVVIAHESEIQTHIAAVTDTSDSLPSVIDIQAYFNHSTSWSVLLAHIQSPTPNDRIIAERIRSLTSDQLRDRLVWDREMREFVEACAAHIRHYSETGTAPTTTSRNAQSDARWAREDFIHKLLRLQSKLDSNGYADSGNRTEQVIIDREKLLEKAYSFLMGTPAKNLRRSRCNISWSGEAGLDYGGPQREFFFRLSRQLFNPYYGLFEYSAHGSYTIQISQHSSCIADYSRWFRFAGRLIGYAIIQGHLLDVFFARHVYKALLGKKCVLSDVEAIDIAFYNSLKYVQDNDPEPLDLNFAILEETFGETSEHELKPNGATISVTNSNKSEYIDLMIKWRLSRGTGPQTESLVKGFREMIPLVYLMPFDPQELEWVIAGTAEIDMDDWKNNTVYWGGYHKDHKVIKWFWRVVEGFTNEQKLRLLQFVTGTSSIPFEGFKALRGSGSLQKFTIDSMSSSSFLPIAHTCFNRMDLPEYRSFEVLRNKLIIAIEECETFENA